MICYFVWYAYLLCIVCFPTLYCMFSYFVFLISHYVIEYYYVIILLYTNGRTVHHVWNWISIKQKKNVGFPFLQRLDNYSEHYMNIIPNNISYILANWESNICYQYSYYNYYNYYYYYYYIYCYYYITLSDTGRPGGYPDCTLRPNLKKKKKLVHNICCITKKYKNKIKTLLVSRK